MKTLLVLTLTLLSGAIFAKPIPIQLTVWNMTRQSIHLYCRALQPGVRITPAEQTIIPNDSPPINITAEGPGSLLSCQIEHTPAYFSYRINAQGQEFVDIKQLKGLANFHYDPDYPGALTYEPAVN